MRSSYLANRAAAQYRSRSIFSYLAIRLFLESKLGRTEKFIESNAVQIVRGTRNSSYHRSILFKDMGANGKPVFRELFTPVAAEALVESYLLSKISELQAVPDRRVCFSYWLTEGVDRVGVFKPYLEGLRVRHRRIADELSASSDRNVLYVDIENFYSSIPLKDLERMWVDFGLKIDLESRLIDLGSELINRQKGSSVNKRLITGPMFSHFLANLYMSDLDEAIIQSGYCILRYVDDFVIVGTYSEIRDAYSFLADLLSTKDLKLHSFVSDKTFNVSNAEWLKGANDFETGPIAKEWRSLVGDIKKLLVLGVESERDLGDAFLSVGMRMPLSDYSAAVRDANAFERIRQSSAWPWLFAKVRGLDPDRVVQKAMRLREKIEAEIGSLLEALAASQGFQRKRVVTKLRYRLGRALYLSSERYLESLLELLAGHKEMKIYEAVIKALVSKNCNEVISLGANVSQMAAQLFRYSLETAVIDEPLSSEVARIGFSIFAVNGVSIKTDNLKIDDSMFNFLIGPVTVEMFDAKDRFLSELCALHGVGEARSGKVLARALDITAEVQFDATGFDYGYSI